MKNVQLEMMCVKEGVNLSDASDAGFRQVPNGPLGITHSFVCKSAYVKYIPPQALCVYFMYLHTRQLFLSMCPAR